MAELLGLRLSSVHVCRQVKRGRRSRSPSHVVLIQNDKAGLGEELKIGLRRLRAMQRTEAETWGSSADTFGVRIGETATSLGETWVDEQRRSSRGFEVLSRESRGSWCRLDRIRILKDRWQLSGIPRRRLWTRGLLLKMRA
uniref:Uncharacterized protein n=1 Tax=Melanopsichium pennsylvanicum 4 TaxID=1398559 RepID=A0A077QTI0_9BASI|nr:uncharacterized protein BN887_06099 [Melanopsichium pennsylvanicum 4]